MQKMVQKGVVLWSNGKNFYVQPTDSVIKQYKEIRKLTRGQDEDSTTGCWIMNSSKIMID